jgi:hypothetical protein
MRVLVAVASRHGATREIAEAIGRTLRERGLDAQVRDVEEAGDRPSGTPSCSGAPSTRATGSGPPRS